MVSISYNYWLIALSVMVTASGCIASLYLARRLHNSSGHWLRVNLVCVATMLGTAGCKFHMATGFSHTHYM